MKRKSTTKAKSAKEPIHLPHFGDLIELRFGGRTTARGIFNAREVRDMLGALERYILRRQKIPAPKLLAAIQTLHDYFELHGTSITITGDLFVGLHGVRLEAIVPGEDGEPSDESGTPE